VQLDADPIEDTHKDVDAVLLANAADEEDEDEDDATV
jgi:hypothetical protein